MLAYCIAITFAYHTAIEKKSTAVLVLLFDVDILAPIAVRMSAQLSLGAKF
jgi:hypothetical protein